MFHPVIPLLIIYCEEMIGQRHGDICNENAHHDTVHI